MQLDCFRKALCMEIKTKLKKKNIKNIFAVTFICVAGLLILRQTYAAESISNLNNNDSSSSCSFLEDGSDDRKKCEELNKRAEIYREIIDIKRKQGESLSNQLEITDSNIAQVEVQMDISKQKIDEYNSEIARIENQIKEKEALIKSQRGILAKLVQSYYEINIASPVISYLADGNAASFIVKKDRVSQTSDKIRELVQSVRDIKSNLESQSSELDKKKGEVVKEHENLKDQGTNLETIKSSKEALIAQTKGEEARYTQLLARVEAQKQELLDIDQYFEASGLSVDSYPKPPSSLFASTSWFFSQRDPAWGNTTIGNTKTLMKSYGCAVTAVAMVLKKQGGSETPATLAKKPIFSGDLISWPSSWSSPRLSLVSSVSHASNAVNWSTVDAQIKKGNPVIVYIGKTQGGGGHYVVIHNKEAKTGKYVVHDPYFGANIYLDTTRALVGAMGVNSSTRIDQMIIYN